MKNKLPNFLIVGAAKSGTTSLYNYLNQHPEVFMPTFNLDGVNVKEPQFFVKQKIINKIHFGIWDWESYKDLFKKAQNHQAIGEASVFYLYYYEEAIKNIKRYLNSEVKIIIILMYFTHLYHIPYFIHPIYFILLFLLLLLISFIKKYH